jgi:Domain of unknown function (DUF6438)
MGQPLKVILLALVLIIVCLAPAFNKADDSSARRATKVITLERTQCFGTCPMYKLTIFSDGTVSYEGIKYVKKVGKASGRITRAKLNGLIEQFKHIDYFNLPDSFEPGQKTCPQEWTDMPSAITSLTWHGKSKTIRHYYGCRGLSTLERLTELEKKIDTAVNVKQWTGQ